MKWLRDLTGSALYVGGVLFYGLAIVSAPTWVGMAMLGIGCLLLGEKITRH